MHRQDLEIPHQGKAGDGKRHSPAFHFSSDNYGYYWLIDYYIHGNPYNRHTAQIETRSAMVDAILLPIGTVR